MLARDVLNISRMNKLESLKKLILGPGSNEDIFLAPHSDDICFSLSHLAKIRGAGTLLTIFPISQYSTDQTFGNPIDIEQITRKRLSEDTAFTALCGLTPGYLNFHDSSARAELPFDARYAYKLADKIQVDLIRALMRPRIAQASKPKYWLFCPSAIGSHVDHAAVLLTIVRNLHLLRMHYRVAFYEDLHYASNPIFRAIGLNILEKLLRGYKLEYFCMKLNNEAQKSKMQAVNLYASQLTPKISSIKSYTPANPDFVLPHEALWLFQDEKLHELG